jgi:hypothetical protein
MRAIIVDSFEKYFHNHINYLILEYILVDSCQRYLLNTIPCSDSPVLVIAYRVSANSI